MVFTREEQAFFLGGIEHYSKEMRISIIGGAECDDWDFLRTYLRSFQWIDVIVFIEDWWWKLMGIIDNVLAMKRHFHSKRILNPVSNVWCIHWRYDICFDDIDISHDWWKSLEFAQFSSDLILLCIFLRYLASLHAVCIHSQALSMYENVLNNSFISVWENVIAGFWFKYFYHMQQKKSYRDWIW